MNVDRLPKFEMSIFIVIFTRFILEGKAPLPPGRGALAEALAPGMVGAR